MITRHEIIQLAKESISKFSFNPDNYLYNNQSINNINNLTVTGKLIDNDIYIKDKTEAKIKINLNKSSGVRVFIGKRFKGSVAININEDNSVIYIGDYCTLNQVQIKSEQKNDCVFIGNSVTTSGAVAWRSGLRSGVDCAGIIIGDDCMFSHGITVRNTDAHPIYNVKTLEQVNVPKSIIHIEPHVWVGQNVLIMKNVKIGACSIVAAGAIVTKEMPRFSKVSGIPAVSKVDDEIFWARSFTDKAKERALFFYNKYKKA